MEIKTIIEIRNNPYYYQYLRENSSWYKALNRDYNNLKLMELEMKDFYKLNFSDKLNTLNSKISMIRTLMDIMK